MFGSGLTDRVNLPHTIGGVEWSLTVGRNRRSGRSGPGTVPLPAPVAESPAPAAPAAPVPTRALAVDGLAALKVGVLILDAGDRPLIVNPAAVELGLVTV